MTVEMGVTGDKHIRELNGLRNTDAAPYLSFGLLDCVYT